MLLGAARRSSTLTSCVRNTQPPCFSEGVGQVKGRRVEMAKCRVRQSLSATQVSCARVVVPPAAPHFRLVASPSRRRPPSESITLVNSRPRTGTRVHDPTALRCPSAEATSTRRCPCPLSVCPPPRRRRVLWQVQITRPSQVAARYPLMHGHEHGSSSILLTSGAGFHSFSLVLVSARQQSCLPPRVHAKHAAASGSASYPTQVCTHACHGVDR